jgi:tetratricopeptide (TPR) repeat protein
MLPCQAQARVGFSAGISKAKSWRIFGRVSTKQGYPLDGVTVRMEISSKAEHRQRMETNLQGEFFTDVAYDSVNSDRLQGILVASKTGYMDGRETFDLSLDEDISRVHIVLRKPEEDPSQLPLPDLVRAIAPRLRDAAEEKFAGETDRTEFVSGCEALIGQNNATEAVSLLHNSVELMPNCLECRLLLSLASFTAGSWSSAIKQLEEASNANDHLDRKRPEPALVTGVLEAWKGNVNKAAELYQHALEADPKNALALQEMGRTQLAQKNWELADKYFQKALQAGAGEGSLLLRVRALLELGDLEEAEREMDSYAAGRKIKDLPQEARELHFTVQSRLTLLMYGQVKSMIDRSPEELIRTVPELQGLEVAEDQGTLEEILKKTGEGVDAFFRNIPNAASREQVHQELLGKDGRVRDSRDQEFQYMMQANVRQPGMGIREYRDPSMGGLMLTSGFASTSSIFHPVNRDGADFRYLGKQTLDGREVYVIAFAQKPRTAKMVTRFVTSEGSALILTHGLAWIDTRSFQIVRLYTSLLDPVPSLRLRMLTTEIQYHQVAFDGDTTTLWLPQTVEIMVDWHGRILRNQHRYSDFMRFNVESHGEKPVAIPNSVPPEK